jgi:hypothetical protein
MSAAPSVPANGLDNAAGAHRKTVVLILSHVMDKDIAAFFENMKEECAKYYDVVFLCDNSSGVFEEFKSDEDFSLFTAEELQYLGYPGRSAVVYQDDSRKSNPYHKNFNFVPGSIDLPVLSFFRENPDYQYYWVVEYDVRYSGSWRRLFTAFADSDADLLATTLTRHAAIPDWYHWPGLDLRDLPIGKDQYLRAFLPLYRISNQALAQLDSDYRRGVAGHFECLGPTLLHHAGFKLEDIGGDGEFVLRFPAGDGPRRRGKGHPLASGQIHPGLASRPPPSEAPDPPLAVSLALMPCRGGAAASRRPERGRAACAGRTSSTSARSAW